MAIKSFRTALLTTLLLATLPSCAIAQYRVVVPGSGSQTAFIAQNPSYPATPTGGYGSCFTMRVADPLNGQMHDSGRVCGAFDASGSYPSARTTIQSVTGDSVFQDVLTVKGSAVGILTNNPVTTLEVNGGAQVDLGLIVGTNLVTSALIVTGTSLQNGNVTMNGTLGVGGNVTLSQSLFIPGVFSSLALGVASVTPGYQMEVNGLVKINNSVTIQNGLAVNGNISTSSGGAAIISGAIINGTSITAGTFVQATTNFSANGTNGVTGATCTQWTMGLCTHL